jgi:molybdopterin-guanine dinucleotide biosynthesis protein A
MNKNDRPRATHTAGAVTRAGANPDSAELRPADAAAVVLAGGRSPRMGTPKALLDFDGEPLVLHIVRVLNCLFARTIVVAAPGQSLPALPAEVVRDEVAYQGPVGGIYYGLDAASDELAFVTSCDVPFLNPRLIAHMLSQAAGYDVVVPHWEARFQPLHAVYRRSVLPFLREQLERSELRPVYLFEKVRTRRVEADEISALDPDGLSFVNMNTPEEYHVALARWRAIREQGAEPPATAVVACTVELFGTARLLGKADKVPLLLGAQPTLKDVFAALAEQLPALAGRVVDPQARALTRGFACNINGVDFVRDPAVRIHSGDNILILAADAGG